MKQLHTEIEIDAPAKRVWELLTDFASYPQWNPFIRYISGHPAPGERLQARPEPPGGRAMTFKPKVLTAEPNRELRWLGHILVRVCSTVSTPSPSTRWRRTVFGSSSEKRSRVCSSPVRPEP